MELPPKRSGTYRIPLPPLRVPGRVAVCWTTRASFVDDDELPTLVQRLGYVPEPYETFAARATAADRPCTVSDRVCLAHSKLAWSGAR